MRAFLLALPFVQGFNLNWTRKGDPEPWACYMDDPSTYLGTVSVAATGQKCMHWRDAADNPDISGQYAGDTKNEKAGAKNDGNFCRAFTADEKPWCYVLGFSPGQAKQDCDVPVCPADGPWARDFDAEAADTIKCTDDSGNPVEDCDCSCDGVAGTAQVAFIQKSTGLKRYCHC